MVTEAREFLERLVNEKVAHNPWAKRAAALAQQADRSLRTARDVIQRDALVIRKITGLLDGTGPAISVLFVGRERFYKDFLFFFGGKQGRSIEEQRTLFQGSLLGLKDAERRFAAEATACDVHVREDLFLASPRPDTFYFYPYLRATLAVQPTLEAQLEHVRSKSHCQKLRKVLRSGLTWRSTRLRADFDRFYDTMYLPHAKLRFKEMAHWESKDDLGRMYEKAGDLVLVEDHGTPVVGSLNYYPPRDPGTLVYLRNGMADTASLTPMQMGERNAAIEVFLMQHAIHTGQKIIDYDLTGPVLSDGVFTHKRRIGCDMQKGPYSPRFALTLREKNRARILSALPLVGERSGQLVAKLGYVEREGAPKLADWSALVRGYLFPSLKHVHVHTDAAPKEGRARLQGILDDVVKDTGTEVTLEYAV